MKPRAARWIMTVAAMMIIAASCDDGSTYYHYRHIRFGLWNSNKIITFDITPTNADPATEYDVFIEIANNNTYPYRNIWLLVDQNLNDTIMHRDTLDIQLAGSATYSKWLGHGATGLYHLSVPYMQRIRFDTTRTYQLQIQQTMQGKTLHGIERIGVKVEKSSDE